MGWAPFKAAAETSFSKLALPAEKSGAVVIGHVSVHGSMVTAVQVRTRCRNMEPDLAAIGPQQPLTEVLRSSARWRPRPARLGREDLSRIRFKANSLRYVGPPRGRSCAGPEQQPAARRDRQLCTGGPMRPSPNRGRVLESSNSWISCCHEQSVGIVRQALRNCCLSPDPPRRGHSR
jgi:hypothetical protein